MFEDIAQFPFVDELEKNWQIIRDEMVAVHNQGFIDWPEKSLLKGEKPGWTTFGLYAFGQKQEQNCLLCPRTTALVEAIPGMTMAGFSRLSPGTHIKSHVGYDDYSRYVLRLHLALESNDLCALRVENEKRVWKEGKALVFCDASDHEAWNQGSRNRTVLLLDFKNPRYKFRILNPILSVEFVEFIKKIRWPEMSMRERFAFRLWQLVNITRKIPPAGYSTKANKNSIR
ncbi:MAG: aspartyl/asparaginyl beta-hydroxylase domain-containing protein [Gammaproteobacteria bacterium]|jgi:beta-hydroxylase|nr:aspartyl/asparaginyl beta-hydroxylase domain-containing protein [Gammaproteobacteria bacterium]